MSDPNRRPPPEPQPELEETVHYDDAVVGRVYRWSGVGLVLVLLFGAAWYVLANRRPAPAVQQVKPLSVPTSAVAPTAPIPVASFTDITRQAGIAFTHVNGAYGEKLLPETMGGGVAFLDFDNDGAQDLLYVNSSFWPERIPAGAKQPTMALYKNDGLGRFADVTAGSGLDVGFYGMGAAVGDYDNDGLVDVFLSAVGGNHLFRNLGGGRFQDVTAQAGVGGSGADWSTSCAWVDYDNDGRLDLFVCNYVRWSREIDIEVGYRLVGLGRAYGQPMNFEGAFSCLYHNEGNGTFRDVSAYAGIQVRNPVTGVPAGKSLGVAPVDLDSDGWLDLIVANDGVQNFVFHNRGDGTFAEIGAATGIAFDSYGRARGAMGIDAGRFRDDEALGILVANFATEMTALYVSQHQPLVFADETIPEGIGPAGLQLLKFGIFFFDFDLDGQLDVLTANGHLEEEIGKIQHAQQYRQPAQLFWNAGPRSGGGRFLPVPPEKCGTDLFIPVVGRGSAFADIDGDGDLDIVLTQTGGPPLLLRNDQNLGHRWLRLKLVGTSVNRDAIGAWLRVRVGEEVLWRHVMPARSYLSQSELPVTIGLGNAAQPDEVEILWPGGARQLVPAPPVNRAIVVTQDPGE